MSIIKMSVTICMNVSPQMACDFQHIFDCLPQGNWFEKPPPPGGGGNIQEYMPLNQCRLIVAAFASTPHCLTLLTRGGAMIAHTSEFR